VTHPEAEDGRREVIANFFLFRVETYALRDVAITCRAENVERHLEAHRLLVASESGGLVSMQLVASCLPFEFGRDISSATCEFRIFSSCSHGGTGDAHPILKPCMLELLQRRLIGL
jgi:hypothetical protein